MTIINQHEHFVSLLTHDLRTPLTAAKLAAQVILRNPNDFEKNNIQALRILKNMNRMDQMIQDLLNVKRDISDKSRLLIKAECDIRQILMNALREMGLRNGERLILEIDKDNLTGYWNADSLRRMIENLVNNAFKYGSLEDFVTIKVIHSNEQVFLDFHNFGQPISLHDQEHLFEVFHRSSSAESGSKKGWGLGLKLVKEVVDEHLGEIMVESNIEDGTRFVITLPRNIRN